jgi:hypothetical protein
VILIWYTSSNHREHIELGAKSQDSLLFSPSSLALQLISYVTKGKLSDLLTFLCKMDGVGVDILRSCFPALINIILKTALKWTRF